MIYLRLVLIIIIQGVIKLLKQEWRNLPLMGLKLFHSGHKKRGILSLMTLKEPCH